LLNSAILDILFLIYNSFNLIGVNMRKKIIITLAAFAILTTGAFCEQPSQEDIQRYSAYYSTGMEALKSHQYSTAIISFKKVLRFSPYDTTVQNALAQSYVARAQYYRSTTKELKKALVDYKSAAFYALYWNKESDSNDVGMQMHGRIIRILTPRDYHELGIKVILDTGRVGRVQEILVY